MPLYWKNPPRANGKAHRTQTHPISAGGGTEAGSKTAPSQHRAQAKIHAYGNSDGQQRKDELAERQPEKQALLIVSDLFVDAYLDWISPPFPFLDFWQTGVAMSAGVC